jgi:hypothetical protein
MLLVLCSFLYLIPACFVTTILYGILLSQTWHYIGANKDRLAVRLFVLAVVVRSPSHYGLLIAR